MEQKKVDRINEFARRVKAGETLTPDELAERAMLRREYVESYRRSLVTQLDNTYILDEQGHKSKLKRKDEDLPPC